jgi:uncharacterized glyoxalase superfamily protein PhnB
VPLQAVPIVRITRAEAAEAFYCERLGFHLDFCVPAGESERDPCYMAISRERALVHLSSHSNDGTPGSIVLILCRNVDALYAEFVAKGVPIQLAPVNQTWGMRELYVRDPDGNTIRFAAPVERS